MFLLSFCTICDLCHFSMIIWFSLSCYDIFLCASDSNDKANSIIQRHKIKSNHNHKYVIEFESCFLVIIELSNV